MVEFAVSKRACTTSKTHPCDAGIISALKTKNRTFKLERALELFDEKFKDIYNVDILTNIMKVKNIWNTMDASVITNFWHHANVLPDRHDLCQSVIDAGLNRRLD